MYPFALPVSWETIGSHRQEKQDQSFDSGRGSLRRSSTVRPGSFQAEQGIQATHCLFVPIARSSALSPFVAKSLFFWPPISRWLSSLGLCSPKSQFRCDCLVFFFFFLRKVNKRTERAQSQLAPFSIPSPSFPPYTIFAKMSDKANVIAQFYNEEGVASGPPLSLPVDVNPEHLALLLNNLLGNVRGALTRNKKDKKVRVRFA